MENNYPKIAKELNQALLGENLLPDTKDTWGQLEKRYPSFDLLHLFYLKKVKTQDPALFQSELQKRSIFFPNTQWLEYLLAMEELPEKEQIPPSSQEEESRIKLSQMLESQASSFQDPVAENEMPLTIKAMHQVDYFESQGIRLDENAAKTDQLGARVKKFTDWLKDMKRISPYPQDLGSKQESTAIVDGFAAKSIESKEDVITEAMAEVLLKQGQINEAIHLYEKLSFLNPAKSTYFAAKIESLKQQ
ncbi:MAG: hypothetical protein JSS67_10565 [Bacteroidetes bacterium]|nr:hypothetical protein [Bacteroidota bacterium]